VYKESGAMKNDNLAVYQQISKYPGLPLKLFKKHPSQQQNALIF